MSPAEKLMVGSGNMKKASNIVLGIQRILLLIPSAWEEKAPSFETIIQKMANYLKKLEKSRFLAVTNQLVHWLYRKEVRIRC